MLCVKKVGDAKTRIITKKDSDIIGEIFDVTQYVNVTVEAVAYQSDVGFTFCRR
jgi:hypothetical protein